MTASRSIADEVHGQATGAASPGLFAKSIDDPVSETDGKRILVSRLWPQGVTREQAALSEWHADWAPSLDLSEWLGARFERWDDFCDRYRDELAARGKLAELRALGQRARSHRITLVFTETSHEVNLATALIRVIRGLH